MSTLTKWNASQIASDLMREHGLIGWRFDTDRAVRRVGCCKYSTKTITVSSQFLGSMSEAELRLVILRRSSFGGG